MSQVARMVFTQYILCALMHILTFFMKLKYMVIQDLHIFISYSN
jgi:hypothetical protein